MSLHLQIHLLLLVMYPTIQSSRSVHEEKNLQVLIGVNDHYPVNVETSILPLTRPDGWLCTVVELLYVGKGLGGGTKEFMGTSFTI